MHFHLLCCSSVTHTLLLSRINSECNHQVSLFLSTAYLQYVNHGCNDVRTSYSPSIHQHSSHPQPHNVSPPLHLFSADLRAGGVSFGATAWSWADLTLISVQRWRRAAKPCIVEGINLCECVCVRVCETYSRQTVFCCIILGFDFHTHTPGHAHARALI